MLGRNQLNHNCQGFAPFRRQSSDPWSGAANFACGKARSTPNEQGIRAFAFPSTRSKSFTHGQLMEAAVCRSICFHSPFMIPWRIWAAVFFFWCIEYE